MHKGNPYEKQKKGDMDVHFDTGVSPDADSPFHRRLHFMILEEKIYLLRKSVKYSDARWIIFSGYAAIGKQQS
jgi:hypothetical protein